MSSGKGERLDLQGLLGCLEHYPYLCSAPAKAAVCELSWMLSSGSASGDALDLLIPWGTKAIADFNRFQDKETNIIRTGDDVRQALKERQGDVINVMGLVVGCWGPWSYGLFA